MFILSCFLVTTFSIKSLLADYGLIAHVCNVLGQCEVHVAVQCAELTALLVLTEAID